MWRGCPCSVARVARTLGHRQVHAPFVLSAPPKHPPAASNPSCPPPLATRSPRPHALYTIGLYRKGEILISVRLCTQCHSFALHPPRSPSQCHPPHPLLLYLAVPTDGDLVRGAAAGGTLFSAPFAWGSERGTTTSLNRSSGGVKVDKGEGLIRDRTGAERARAEQELKREKEPTRQKYRGHTAQERQLQLLREQEDEEKLER
ncbi:hypothetical protein B0H16DRAFT_1742545 [Mycena metata]|uniref:Uncharacterized protein n=1 Tax=Mycena metata TaxID=1033252 RepID=A0AAD7MFW3_9AGAR|nr:hypothetical protein B0H16DRAFT_1742545 [Mycena metata]